MEKIVEIPYNQSVYVERLFFEYNANCNLINYLMSQETVKKEILDEYVKENYRMYSELEIAKTRVSNEYFPEEFAEKEAGYTFDFDNNSIVYTVNE